MAEQQCWRLCGSPTVHSSQRKEARFFAVEPARYHTTLRVFGRNHCSRRLSAGSSNGVVHNGNGNSLMGLELMSILNEQGMIQPPVSDNMSAFVFAIYDENKKLQYIGFSKNLQSSLRTVFTRRPDKAYYYKVASFEEVNQEQMVGTRSAWFEEAGGPPPGNKLAMERSAWQSAIDAGAISQKGKLKAAEEKCREMLDLIKSRGCMEEYLPNTTLLQDGVVDFLPAKSLTAAEVAKQKEELERIAQSTRTLTTIVDGQEIEVSIFFRTKYRTNGGYMVDVVVTTDNVETRHRIIIGKNYYEPYNVEPEAVVEIAFSFILSQKMTRQTEGMLLSDQFPVNYFSISELEQWYPEFENYYSKVGELTGKGFWRFNRIGDYGGYLDNTESFSLALEQGAA